MLKKQGEEPLTNATGSVVVSTRYRQGPEHRFPAAHDDDFDAYRWLLDNAKSIRSDGEMLAKHLRDAGVPVRQRTYPGVTHEFFGMGAVVDKAKDAVAFAAEGLKNP